MDGLGARSRAAIGQSRLPHHLSTRTQLPVTARKNRAHYAAAARARAHPFLGEGRCVPYRTHVEVFGAATSEAPRWTQTPVGARDTEW